MSDSSSDRGAQMTSMSQSWFGLALIMIIGVLALISLYMGFQSYSTDNQDLAYMYMLIGAAGFAAIGYMFFRTKAVTVQQKTDVNRVSVVTTLECPKCNLKRVRDFQRGDYIFKDDEPCTRCDGKMMITRIAQKKEEAGKKQPTEL
jgi:Tfp pilus assembly protein PilV